MQTSRIGTTGDSAPWRCANDGGWAGTEPALVALLLAMLAGSLLHLVQLPVIDKGMNNAVVPSAALGIMYLRRAALIPAIRHYRLLVLATSLVYGWMWISAFASPYRDIALVQATKHSGYLFAFAGLTILLHGQPSGARLGYLRVVLYFLLALALLGVVEFLWPGVHLYDYFRSRESMIVYPRIAGFMLWPNQFGVLMALAATVAILLWDRARLRGGVVIAVLGVSLFCLAISGSRNAWLVFLFGMVCLVVAKRLDFLRFGLIMAAFAVMLLSFHVPVRQLGIGDNDWVPLVRHDPYHLDRDSEVTLAAPTESVAPRTELWVAAVEEIAGRPLLGIGIETFQRVISIRVKGEPGFNTHNLFLNIAVELGLVGLALVLAWCFVLARYADWRNPVYSLPPVALVSAQMLDCFIYDYTFMVVFMFTTAMFATSGHEHAA